MTDKHIQKKTIQETWAIPTHGKRNTKLFNKYVKRLKKDGNYFCWITWLRTGEKISTNLEVHHLCEFSEENNIDWGIATRLLTFIDFYGYSKSDEFKDIPIIGADDVRNFWCISKKYHTLKGTGLHLTTVDIFFLIMVCKVIPVVDEVGETIEQVEQEMQ